MTAEAFRRAGCGYSSSGCENGKREGSSVLIKFLYRSPVVFGLLFAVVLSIPLAAVLFIALDRGLSFDNCLAVPDDGEISRAGQYCLSEDLVVKRDVGIRILASNVVLDLQGYTVRYDGDVRQAEAFGIFAQGENQVTIRNGTISGWWYGVHALSVDGITLSDLNIVNIAYIGLSAANTRNLVISGNKLSDFRHDIVREKSPYVIGMNIKSEGCLITDNVFDDRFGEFNELEREVETVHILMPAGVTTDCVIARNQIKADRVSYKTYGIWVGRNVDVYIKDNEIENHRYSITIDSGARSVVASNRLRITSSVLSVSDHPAGKVTLDSTAIFSQSSEITVLNNELSGFERPMTLLDGGVVEGNRVIPAAK